MASILDLNVRQLKKELEARHLTTRGNKSKLQARLLKSMEDGGENSKKLKSMEEDSGENSEKLKPMEAGPESSEKLKSTEGGPENIENLKSPEEESGENRENLKSREDSGENNEKLKSRETSGENSENLKSVETSGENNGKLKAKENNGESSDKYEYSLISDEDMRTPVPMEMTALMAAIAGIQENLIQNAIQVEGMQQYVEDNLVQNSGLVEKHLQENVLKMEKSVNAEFTKLRECLCVHLKKYEERLLVIEEVIAQLCKNKTEIQATDKNIQKDKPDKKGSDCEIIVDNSTPKFADSLHLSPPIFDGVMPISIFKLQFEMSVKLYKWNDEEKLAALVLALKGNAISILQTFTNMPDLNYEAVMAALERKYDSEHWRQINNMLLVSRVQKCNETIRDYADDIERLTNLAYGNYSKDLLEITKIHSFIRGLRNCDIKQAVYSMPKPTFIETLSHAVAQEVAFNLVYPKHNDNDTPSSNPERTQRRF